jgi:hypothetical protein
MWGQAFLLPEEKWNIRPETFIFTLSVLAA